MRTQRQASFQIAGPNNFNKMPKHIIELIKCGQDDFKKILDTYISKIPDNPKIQGLVPAALTAFKLPPFPGYLVQETWEGLSSSKIPQS